ncbi:sigma factor-like helix-turn-helix DNA-binding protein [Streptomyces sp. RFCAC02]|uniref:RNA polymerase sigma factor n=1 Tax=Streptomyces sp. RFCAC02 TaxID=2499143 RepID=UPI001022738B|nr:sigma factor-like helix-turn-helix DNA-binding protein [Streptomyces sp. RFCAC02]
MAHQTPPEGDRGVRRRLERGDAAALSELYDRYAPLSYGIAHRILGDGAGDGDPDGDAEDDPAAAVTREVFARLWERPAERYPAHGPLRSWIAAESHRLAVERLRRSPGPGTPEETAARERAASTAARADYIVSAMPVPLRDALRLARFQRHDYRETARLLGITDAEARRRLRLGLQLLSTAAGYSPEPDGTAAGAGTGTAPVKGSGSTTGDGPGRAAGSGGPR